MSKQYKAKLVGTGYSEGARETLKSLPNETPVVLRREPKNPYDKYAISVWFGEIRLGYIARANNRAYAEDMDHGVSLSAVIACENPALAFEIPLVITIGGEEW